MQIKIENKIAEKIDEYQRNTGATKTWIAEKLGISSQRLFTICKAENVMLDVAFKFAHFLNCDIKDIFEYQIIEK